MLFKFYQIFKIASVIYPKNIFILAPIMFENKILRLMFENKIYDNILSIKNDYQK